MNKSWFWWINWAFWCFITSSVAINLDTHLWGSTWFIVCVANLGGFIFGSVCPIPKEDKK